MTVGLSILPAKTPTIPSSNNNNNKNDKKRRPKTISTFPTDPKTLLLNQCNTQRDLHQLHAHLIKTPHLFSHDPSLLSQYLLESAALSRHGNLAYALSIFRHIDRPTAPAYNILIRAFNANRSMRDSLALYDRMRADSVEPDEHTFSCALKSCSMLGAFQEAEQIHAHVIKFGFGSNGFVKNTLIHVYATCGDLEIARRVFDGMDEKGIVTWNSMIAGYSKSGDWGSVLDLFYEMRQSRVSFDEVTMISVLTACGRLGDLGLGEWMDGYIVENGLMGNRNLVTSLIDMYAKCGEIDKAYRWFEGMRNRDVVAWSAMISGYSQSNRCLEALMLFQEMRKADVEPNEITMVSVLSSCAVLGAFETGKWVHSFIRKNRLRLTVTLGTTLIDFYAKCGFIESSIQDTAHPRARAIYDKVEEMMGRIKSVGYRPNTAEARLDAEEDEKEASVSHHSEKLAIAFGLIQSSPGATIRVSKNLRVCTDCHSATKLISKVYEREIVVRDRNRFHHFRNGSCSCKDYW
ncbi:Pentatricopeptide repeat-containing protein [Acorus calamus]|uniref:Pentatricopeptide repeat-containing protein n=1 Tax=Acorus calamus TaxID=4465 RepID=A0AAV9F690_ACOCL|nr:Pentatricopeptide repeat-containing protein [Acorus calamus]